MIDYKKTGIKIAFLIAIILGIILSLMLGMFFWPFVVAIITSIILDKLVESIVRKIKIPRKVVGIVLVLLLYVVIAFIIYVLISKLLREAIDIVSDIPGIFEYIKNRYNYIYEKYISAIHSIPASISQKIYDLGLGILSGLSKYITKIFNETFNFIMFIPNILIYIIITLLATLFLVTDKRKLSMYVHDILPKKFVRKISNIFKGIITSLGQYLKAQLFMICITFVELLIAFFILKQPYPFTFALVISIIDALPIVGVGGILIPWGIYSATVGNMYLAGGLLITYVVIIIMRQLIEPRIVSNNLGVHPFITLISMYIAFKIFGIIGLIIGPIIMVVFKNVFSQLFENGYLKNIIVYNKST